MKEPYNPLNYIDLCRADIKLGFSDIAVANAHRATILLQAALCMGPKYFDYKRLSLKVQETFIKLYGTLSPPIIFDHLQKAYCQAYQELLRACLDAAAYWDGLELAKFAIGTKKPNKKRKGGMFPEDEGIMETVDKLRDAFLSRNKELKKQGAEGHEVVLKSRLGKIYQKHYPWLDAKLNWRTPTLINQINEGLGSGSCEIRPVVFGNVTNVSTSTDQGDMGSLGLFAKRDIKRAELVILDECLTGVSDIPPSRFEHCDACHASLVFPFICELEKVYKPSCCNKVAFCSKECYDTAANGYHKVICGKAFEWLYEGINEKTSANHTRWRPIMFLRVISIIVADRNATPAGKKRVHPMQHPLMAVMTANYPPPDVLQPNEPCDWQFFENVEAPTRILLQLGVDIFNEPDFSPEVIQTIYWRMENNGNMSTFNAKLAFEDPASIPKRADSIRDEIDNLDLEGAVHMHCLNPKYLFLNHSCEPNLDWHGAAPTRDDPVEWFTGPDGKLVKMGSSAVFCKAARDIKAGEELKISYIGDPLCVKGDFTEEVQKLRRLEKRMWMTKWFEGGCGCVHCEREKVEDEKTGEGEMIEEEKIWQEKITEAKGTEEAMPEQQQQEMIGETLLANVEGEKRGGQKYTVKDDVIMEKSPVESAVIGQSEEQIVILAEDTITEDKIIEVTEVEKKMTEWKTVEDTPMEDVEHATMGDDVEMQAVEDVAVEPLTG